MVRSMRRVDRATLQAVEAEHLHKHWQALRGKIAWPADAPLETRPILWEEWWTYLRDSYSSADRRYHTLAHLCELYWHLERATKEGWLDRPELVALAIWFHDIVYTGTNARDENESAEAFQKFGLDVGLALADTETVAEWIRLTASHSCTLASHGSDCCFFMDFDMSVLGKPWSDSWAGYSGPGHRGGYAGYALNLLIDEYAELKKVPEWARGLFLQFGWCFGRFKFLTQTQQSEVFVTERYKKLYGPDARQNISRERQHWQLIKRRTYIYCVLIVLSLVALMVMFFAIYALVFGTTKRELGDWAMHISKSQLWRPSTGA